MLFEKNQTVLFIGDSISDYDRARPVGEGNGIGRSYVANVNALLGCMYPELNLRITNMGISGNRVTSLKRRWETDVMDRHPDWVCVLIGINDVWRHFDCPAIPEEHNSPEVFETTYEELIQRTLPHVKGMILMSPFFMEPNKNDPMRIMMDEFTAIVRKLAEKYNLTYIDLQAGWDELFKHMHPCNIAWDRVHPNQTGCMYLAKVFLKAIGAERC